MVIPADIDLPPQTIQLDNTDLSAYQTLVGGHIQAIHLERPAATMYLNDEGKLEGLPVNHRATALASVHNSAFRGQDFIVGDAFVTGPADARGYDRTVPARYPLLWLEATTFRVEKQLRNAQGWRVRRGYIYDNVHVAYVAAVRLARRETEVTEVRVVPVNLVPPPDRARG